MAGLDLEWVVFVRKEKFVSRRTVVVAGVIISLLLSDAFAITPFYVDNGLQQTVILDRVQKREKRELQQEILTLLGLHHRPKPMTHNQIESAPKFMLDLYKTLSSSQGEDFLDDDDGVIFHSSNTTSRLDLDSEKVDGSDVIMSFVNHARDSGGCRTRGGGEHGYASLCRRSASKVQFMHHDKEQMFFFEFSEVAPGEMVNGAELRLYKEKEKSRKWADTEFTIEAYRFVQGQDPEEKQMELESSITVMGDKEGWLKLNVTHAVDAWTLFPASNSGMYIRVMNQKGREVKPSRIGIVGSSGPADKQAFMVGFFRMSKELHVRRTRSTRTHQIEDVSFNDDPYSTYVRNAFQQNRRQSGCARHALYVSFRDLGWQDWIIAPDGYSAFYCNGECAFPLGAHMNATNHAIVQTLVHLLDPYLVPKPCCAPTKLSPISVLYFDHNSNVVLKRYKDMIVKACGCH